MAQKKVKAHTGPRVKTSVAIDPTRWEQARIQALRERRAVYALLEDALDLYLAQAVKKGGR